MTVQCRYDVLIVGAGFGGIYQLYKLVKEGYHVKLIDMAGGPGGTWWWNRYPGAQSDTESFVYRYSWDAEDLQSYDWPEHYTKQPDAMAYIAHVINRHDLGQYIQYNTELQSAQYDEPRNIWQITTSTGTIEARYLVTALGLLSSQNWPKIPGINTYQGELYHTGKFPAEYNFKNKRVGVVGCGSTGTQLITTIAKDVKTLTCFQRRVQYSVPAGDGPVSKEYREWINKNYNEIWSLVNNSVLGMGFKESTVSALSVTEEERERKYQEAWDRGNGLRFMFWTFSDISTNLEANETACKFIRKKIAEIVQDPEKRRKLTPKEPYARRPLCDTGYYQQFNRPNVDIVDLKETPITEITNNGIVVSDGTLHELDVIIFATGFDAVDGSYIRLAIKGRDGKTLQDHWTDGPTSYLGCSVPGFPNFFMISGPKSPFANIPPVVQIIGDFITSIIMTADEVNSPNSRSKVILEATPEAEASWLELCDVVSAPSLFRATKSWMFGANIEGKKHSVLFFLGGIKMFRDKLREVVEAGFNGYKPFGTPPTLIAPKSLTCYGSTEVRQDVADGLWH